MPLSRYQEIDSVPDKRTKIKVLHAGMRAQVAQGNIISIEFARTTGVRKGHILALTLFSQCLSAGMVMQEGFSESYQNYYGKTNIYRPNSSVKCIVLLYHQQISIPLGQGQFTWES